MALQRPDGVSRERPESLCRQTAGDPNVYGLVTGSLIELDVDGFHLSLERKRRFVIVDGRVWV